MAKILLGVTGGIAAYKAASVVAALEQKGHAIKVIMTENAKKFITPLTMAIVSKNPVYDDASEWVTDPEIKHIELAKWADIFVVVPATAETLAKFAHGHADNLLASTYLALPMPSHRRVLLFPAMNTNMWDKPQTQENLMKIRTRPHHMVIDPEEGRLACGDVGMGKLPSTPTIVKWIENQETIIEMRKENHDLIYGKSVVSRSEKG